MKKWFRIHLSTAIVVMIVASGLLWLNLTPFVEDRVEWQVSPLFEFFDSGSVKISGWELYLLHFRSVHFGFPYASRNLLRFRPEKEEPTTGLSEVEVDAFRKVSVQGTDGIKFGEMRFDEFLVRFPNLAGRMQHDLRISREITDLGDWDCDGLLYDTLFAVGVVTVIGACCEWYVRRR